MNFIDGRAGAECFRFRGQNLTLVGTVGVTVRVDARGVQPRRAAPTGHTGSGADGGDSS